MHYFHLCSTNDPSSLSSCLVDWLHFLPHNNNHLREEGNTSTAHFRLFLILVSNSDFHFTLEFQKGNSLSVPDIPIRREELAY